MIPMSKVLMPSGKLTLELEFIEPSSQSRDGGNKLAVLLHPWSRLGGRMTDHVLHGLSGFLRGSGYHVVVFNSRGVGQSSGWPSFTGLQEVEDLKEVVQWGLARVPDVREVLLVGYSHGALVASLHPPLPQPIKTSHILLSYPLSVRSWITCFHGGTYARGLEQLLSNASANVLVIFGTADQFTGADAYKRWLEELQSTAAKQNPQPKIQGASIDGADHFWDSAHAAVLYRSISRWLES